MVTAISSGTCRSAQRQRAPLAAHRLRPRGWDRYTGLDRFGRIVDQRWINSTDDDVDRFGYGYDRDSNRLYRENAIDSSLSELYHDNGSGNGYDPLNRLTAFARGTLNGAKDTISAPARSQEWDLDALGNWNSITNDGGTPEEREHNAQNQVTDVGGNGLTFDNNGNTTTDEQGRQLAYDAWNRLVTVKTAGNVLLAQYAYDGHNWRITENSGTARELYYSSQWQVVEERESGVAVVQNVWSPVYIDAMILRDRDANATGGDGLNNQGLEEHLYALHDANYNMTAIVSVSGLVIERFIETPYGQVTFLDATFTPLNPNQSAVAWQYLDQGMRLDRITGNYAQRAREWLTLLGRWGQPDPAGYIGSNLYVGLANNPTNNVDPTGLREIGIFIDGAGQVAGNGTIMESLSKKYGRNPDDISAYLTMPLGSIGLAPYAFNNVVDSAMKQLGIAFQNAVDDAEKGKCDSFSIDLFGWSRGAIAAMTVAAKLNSRGLATRYTHRVGFVAVTEKLVQKPIRVRFLGVIDPVAGGIGWRQYSNTLSSNIKNSFWAVADNFSAFNIWGVAWTAPPASFAGLTVKHYAITHDQSGFSGTLTIESDLQVAAEAAGVEFK